MAKSRERSLEIGYGGVAMVASDQGVALATVTFWQLINFTSEISELVILYSVTKFYDSSIAKNVWVKIGITLALFTRKSLACIYILQDKHSGCVLIGKKLFWNCKDHKDLPHKVP